MLENVNNIILEKIGKTDLLETVKILSENKKRLCTIVLIDGSNLSGEIRSVSKDNLTIDVFYWSIYIPIDKIAGIIPLSLIDSGSHMNLITKKSYQYLSDLSFTTAQEKKFKMGPIQYMLPPLNVSFSGEGVEAENLIYSNWNYFIYNSGGINSLGLSLLGQGGSIGWNRGLIKNVYKKLKKKDIILSQVCEKEEAFFSGFIHFIEGNRETMDGKNWMPAIITREDLGAEEKLKKPWILCYFCEDSFLFPQKIIEIVSKKIKIFGEIFPIKVQTEQGDSSCFVKVAAAKSLKYQNTEGFAAVCEKCGKETNDLLSEKIEIIGGKEKKYNVCIKCKIGYKESYTERLKEKLKRK